MSHCWMWSKLNYFITGVVNWDMSENRGNYARFSIKGLMFKKNKICPTMFRKILMENVTV